MTADHTQDDKRRARAMYEQDGLDWNAADPGDQDYFLVKVRAVRKSDIAEGLALVTIKVDDQQLVAGYREAHSDPRPSGSMFRAMWDAMIRAGNRYG